MVQVVLELVGCLQAKEAILLEPLQGAEAVLQGLRWEEALAAADHLVAVAACAEMSQGEEPL